jgi:hypothetical protein
MKDSRLLLINNFLFVFALIVFLQSCKKDYDPDLIGTWIAEETVPLNGYPTKVKDVITFSKNRFTDLIQIYIPSLGNYYDYKKLSGSISITGSTMYLALYEIGFMSYPATDGNPPGPLTFQKKGDLQFYYNTTHGVYKEFFNAVYTLSGNKLTIMSDNNSDGDYSDPLETTVYTRQ